MSLRDRGAADALGLVLIAPAVIGLAVLVVSLGRRVDSLAQTRSAAETAAQSAALERSPRAAREAAQRSIDRQLVDQVACRSPRVAIDTTRFRAGGIVTVTIECRPSDGGLGAVGGSAESYVVRASASIDRFRTTRSDP